jgi:hypothetical protein
MGLLGWSIGLLGERATAKLLESLGSSLDQSQGSKGLAPLGFDPGSVCSCFRRWLRLDSSLDLSLGSSLALLGFVAGIAWIRRWIRRWHRLDSSLGLLLASLGFVAGFVAGIAWIRR